MSSKPEQVEQSLIGSVAAVRGTEISPTEQRGILALSLVLSVLPPRLQARAVNSYISRRRPAPGQSLQTRMVDGTRLRLDLGDRMQSFALLTRTWSPEIVAMAVSRLPPGGLFVDVGANVGLISLSVARQRPDATVIGFEPHPTNAAAWTANRALNSLANAHLEVFGVGERSGATAMALSSDLGSGFVTDDGDIPLVLTTLDDYAEINDIERIDFLKIDVEGGEPGVLDGATRLLDSGAIRCLVVELNEHALARAGTDGPAVVERLITRGYVPVEIPPAQSRWTPLPVDPGLVDRAFLAP